MSYETQLEFLLAQAAYADEQANKATDAQVRDTWARVAKSCRHMASLYRTVGSQGAKLGNEN